MPLLLLTDVCVVSNAWCQCIRLSVYLFCVSQENNTRVKLFIYVHCSVPHVHTAMIKSSLCDLREISDWWYQEDEPSCFATCSMPTPAELLGCGIPIHCCTVCESVGSFFQTKSSRWRLSPSRYWYCPALITARRFQAATTVPDNSSPPRNTDVWQFPSGPFPTSEISRLLKYKKLANIISNHKPNPDLRSVQFSDF